MSAYWNSIFFFLSGIESKIQEKRQISIFWFKNFVVWWKFLAENYLITKFLLRMYKFVVFLDTHSRFFNWGLKFHTKTGQTFGLHALYHVSPMKIFKLEIFNFKIFCKHICNFLIWIGIFFKQISAFPTNFAFFATKSWTL